MSASVREILQRLQLDPWRQNEGFSEDIAIANEHIIGNSEDVAEAKLNEWLITFQPCLFGRVAARLGLLSYCLLTESDLNQPDDFIRDKIQESRREWTRLALDGEKSGFIILAASKNIAVSLPDENATEF